MNHARQLQLAKAAGFFNGEGTTSLTRNNNRNPLRQTYIRMSVSQLYDIESVEQFRDALQMGNITTYRQTGRVYRLNGYENVIKALRLLWPWLSTVKKQQAIQAVREYRRRRVHGYINTELPTGVQSNGPRIGADV